MINCFRTRTSPRLKQHILASSRRCKFQQSRLYSFNHKSRFWNEPRSIFKDESLSNVCGHLSFCLLGASYVTQDILSLRCLAMGGISLSIVFQYFRTLPLWIPIRWNSLFLAINGFMVAFLVKERTEANLMAPWQRQLYETEFAHMGFTEVEFCRLLETSKKLKKAKGAMVCIEGVPQDKMYFVLSGEIEVKSKGEAAASEHLTRTIATITDNSFIGEMTFLAHLQEISAQPAAEVATASCVCSKETEVLEWNFSDLVMYLKLPANRGVANALQAKLSNDLRLKLKTLNRRQTEKNIRT
mmetsp:Transcript_27184/g.51506  ORF Transcript_27184/g.51506 Transcript_27184/m.51506 type:complete len:299 (+) Transcript_27184:125-1021(+)